MEWTPQQQAIVEAMAAGARYPVARFELHRDGDPRYCEVVQGYVHWDAPAQTAQQADAYAAAFSELAQQGAVVLEDASRVWVAGDFDVYYKSPLYARLCQETLAQARENPESSGLLPYLRRAYASLTPAALGALSARR